MPGTQPIYVRQQKHRRVVCEARVVRYDGPSGEWNSVNMSAGGMFVTGAPILSPGTELDVGVWLPDGPAANEIVGHARVIWINDPETGDARPQMPFGMGLELVRLADDDRATLQAHLYGDDTCESHHPDEPIVDSSELGAIGRDVGPYRVLDLIATGGMGQVFLAEHTRLGHRVALKRLHQRLSHDPQAVRRFHEEGRLVNRLRHDNILQIVDFIIEGTDHYYVMELLEGETLEDLILQDGALPLDRAIHVGAQLADALQAVHEAGIVHRDVKPGNVLLTERRGVRDFVKLLDFGIARPRGPDPYRKPGVAVGTPAYMAPEQCLGEDPDARADVYALGAVLFHMLTGRTLFETESWSQMLEKQVQEKPPHPQQVAPCAIPKRLQSLVLRCLHKQPRRRPASAAAVADELRAIGATVSQSTRTFRPRRRRGEGTVLFASAATALLLAASGFALTARPRPAPGEEGFSPAHAKLTAPPAPEAANADEDPALTPSQVTAMLHLATTHVREGDHAAAVKICRTIARRQPGSAAAYRTLGIAYSHLGANRQACAAYRRYLALAPDAPDIERLRDILAGCQ